MRKDDLKLHGVDFTLDDFADQQKLLAGRPVRVVIDGGANIGNTTAVYTDLFRESEVFSFEPYPPAYERLAERFSGNGRVHPVKAAIGAGRSSVMLFRNDYADTNSLLARPLGARRYWAADNQARGQEGVQVISLDEFAQEHNLDRIDVLKLDLQGGEAGALEGAQQLLGSQRIDLVYCEVFFVPHYEGALLFHELTGIFSGVGYSLYNLTHLVRGGNGQLRFADALYVSTRIRDSVVDAFPAEA